MNGKIYTALTPFYNIRTNRKEFKKRPCLILYGPRNGDYTVLPVSTISRPHDRDADFDVLIDPQVYPKLCLNKQSYIRTHKQTTVHHGEIHQQVSDLQAEYGELYKRVLNKVSEFNALVQASNTT